MMESVIISTLAGSVICSAVLIFKNKILSLFGGRALYYISLFAMLIFILPIKAGEISLSEIPIHQKVNVTGFHTVTPDENIDNVQVETEQQAPQEV